jgi:hypothetical protein
MKYFKSQVVWRFGVKSETMKRELMDMNGIMDKMHTFGESS